MNDESILRRLEASGNEAPRMALEGTLRSANAAERYEILSEVAHGGVGAVYRGRDNDLGRDVAIKVLLDEHLESADLVQRFVEEAQIGGQLQHPGIVPVYELGMQTDQRPFFAMKLVKGETLADRLSLRSKPSKDHRALVSVFRDVCRTMAYAHARGVIHRDLKPSNVMIGGFGEVQVVDWGFAKVLPRDPTADERVAEKAAPQRTIITTVRSKEGSSTSIAGSVMGTPAYMPPEQAMGRVDDLDPRSDIFSLGAILCEILTGSPPYAGDASSSKTAAATADLSQAHAALDRCGAERRLVEVCRHCLEPLPKDRPSSAESVADEVAAWLAEAEGREHRAQVEKLEAEAEAEEQNRARRQTTLLALGTVAVVTLAVALLMFISLDSAERERGRRAVIEAAIQDATRLRSSGALTQALAAARRAVDLGAEAGFLTAIENDAEAAAERVRISAQDDEFLAELERIRGRRGQTDDDIATDAAYDAAFKRRFGTIDASAARLASSHHKMAFAANLDFWGWIRKTVLGKTGWEAVQTLGNHLDPSNADLRAALIDGNSETLLAIVKQRGERLPPTSVAQIGLVVAEDPQDVETALAFLLKRQRRATRDFWINRRIAMVASVLKRPQLAAEHWTLALGARSKHATAWLELGRSLIDLGEIENGVNAVRRAIAIDGSLASRPEVQKLLER